MNLFQIVVLAIIQGITEFLPVSSSGHLVIMQKLFGFSSAPVAFDVLLHLGSLIAMVIFLRKSLTDLFFKWKKNLDLITLILVSSIPAALFGFLFKKTLEETFNSLTLLSISYLVTALLLFSTKLIQQLLDKKEKSLKEVKISDAIIVGLFQALAILPGISRSGATITAGLWSGFSEATAFTFSFFLAIPAIIGASLLEFPKMLNESGSWGLGLLGMAISAASSFFAIKALEKVLKGKKLFLFGWYCLILSLFLLFRPAFF